MTILKNIYLKILIIFLIIIFLILFLKLFKEKKKEYFGILKDTSEFIKDGVLTINDPTKIISLAKSGYKVFQDVTNNNLSSSVAEPEENCSQKGCSSCQFTKPSDECKIKDCNPDKLNCWNKWNNDLSEYIINLIDSNLNLVYNIDFYFNKDPQSRINSLNNILVEIGKTDVILVNPKNGLLTTKNIQNSVNSNDIKKKIFNYLLQLEMVLILISKLKKIYELIEEIKKKVPSKIENNLLMEITLELEAIKLTKTYNLGSLTTKKTFNPSNNIIKILNLFVNIGKNLNILNTLKNDNKNHNLYFIKLQLNHLKNSFIKNDCCYIEIPTESNSTYQILLQSLNSLAGNKYIIDGSFEDNSESIENKQLPINIAAQATNKNNYSTLKNCQNVFNSFNINLPRKDENTFKKLENIKNQMEQSLETCNTNMMKKNIKSIRDIYFNKIDGQWEMEPNSNLCIPKNSNNFNYQTDNLDLKNFDFESLAKNIELQRKKILYIKEKLNRYFWGKDIEFEYSQNVTTPTCPEIDDPKRNVLEWVPKEYQSDSCKENPFYDEEKNQDNKLTGLLEPGKIEKNKDYWIDF